MTGWNTAIWTARASLRAGAGKTGIRIRIRSATGPSAMRTTDSGNWVPRMPRSGAGLCWNPPSSCTMWTRRLNFPRPRFRIWTGTSIFSKPADSTWTGSPSTSTGTSWPRRMISSPTRNPWPAPTIWTRTCGRCAACSLPWDWRSASASPMTNGTCAGGIIPMCTPSVRGKPRKNTCFPGTRTISTGITPWLMQSSPPVS